MVDLDWCKKQRMGIKLVEANDNLAREYLRNAEETLGLLRGIEGKSNMWLATMKYYFEYFCAYAVLMKIGIKCEIHDCTIKFYGLLGKEKIVSEKFCDMLKKDKSLRIDNQYYLKNKKVNVDYDFLSEFLLEMKSVINGVDDDKINEIRMWVK